MAKALLIAADPAAALRLQQLIREVRPEVKILQKIDTLEKAVTWLKENTQPDLILLDARLSNGPSFQIFEQVKIDCPVIFITGCSEFALKAYRVESADYLLRPVEPRDVEHALDAYNQSLQTLPSLSTLLQPAPKNRINRILIRFGQSIKLIETSDIAYFYTRDKMTFLVLQSTAKRIPVDYSLDKLESMLDPQVFFRINRQFIIHINAIREMFPGAKAKVMLSLNPPIDYEAVVSSDKSGLFKKWLVGEAQM